MIPFIRKHPIWFIFLFLVLAVVLFFILPASVPILVAFVTALLLHPLVRLLHTKTRIKRASAVMFVFIGFLIFLGLSIYFIVTRVITQGIRLIENIPTYVDRIFQGVSDLEAWGERAQDYLPNEYVAEITLQVETFLKNAQTDIISQINLDSVINFSSTLLTNIPNVLIDVLVYLIALFLFLLELPRLKKGLYQFFTEKTADKVDFMASRLSYVVFGFAKAQFLVSLLIFIVCLIGLLIIAPEVALLMSIIIWLIDLIPIIGSIVILAPWSIYHFLSGDASLATELAILAAVLLIIRRTVEPKVMGRQIGLSPLATLIAMYLGLKLLGLLGFILGPLLVIAFNSAREAGIIKLNFKL
ncbi:sporulation integral membrane protein YtvI [Bacillus fonticola]|uniref:sporulation integral membrane protein YtvI n=1 Tax=Bacillus fonticola TaxID=2728853 RepID=UPI0014764D3B|nr:sporulation integral membrane protein YtvI [Bacillus fonticola]